MIYLFGIKDQVSVIVQGDTLTEADKAKATLVLDTLPEPEVRKGYYSVIYIDPDTKAFSYVYREIPQDDEIF